MSTGTYRFFFAETEAVRRRCPAGATALTDRDVLEPPFKLENLPTSGHPPPIWAQDLLLVSRAAFLADRKAKRNEAPDRWSRKIELSVPVFQQERWSSAVCDDMNMLLETLTGDKWELIVRNCTTRPHGIQGRFDEWMAEEVDLFSGGIDSTAFAASRANCSAQGALTLLMFADGSLKSTQIEVFERVRRLAQRKVERADASHTPRDVTEMSSRSRGLLFIATGIALAASSDCAIVGVPENGQLAVNIPLTPNRTSAASSRSVHPRTLFLLNSIVGQVTDEAIRVVNPWLNLTKGEVCRQGLDAGLTEEDLVLTVSCGHPPSKRLGFAHHCGRCYPCLVRRAGLMAALGRDKTSYEVDFWRIPVADPRAADALALQRWLAGSFSVADIMADLPLPPDTAPKDLLPVLQRGRQELAAMFDAVLPPDSPYR